MCFLFCCYCAVKLERIEPYIFHPIKDIAALMELVRFLDKHSHSHAYLKSIPDLVGVAKTQAAKALEKSESGS